ncbi:hypothetical protein JS84_03815 [Vibrio vulnificus]|uniref:hypothetical protein n=1 Tax=Vibrio vulnificus TaxID=672 RepID=UPI00034779E2|nr:hypothetical protein [Vibrio vulnificus]KFK59492.1 hypothetical protein JS83_13000 [Vibrio vulnificus]KFK65848.1 hypothetical protein JS84_03815 [Vibrio vulnificus]KFK67119.1 hypothetical protein JS85_21850 [Vibrio vulnificus]NHE86118.1 hypothetical protein [Vibrio vulnificus]POC62798.1 hypothetical protein CRN44_14055 [Vibrio vulnificus]
MNAILKAASAIKRLLFQDSETQEDKLHTFLTQCHKQNIRLSLLADQSKTYQLKTLIKPLKLSRTEAKRLLKTHLSPMTCFDLGAAEFFSAMKHPEQQAFPCQVCDNCAPGLFKHYGYLVADTSWCSQCHEKGECIDVALIEHYRKLGIDDDTIWKALPRTRWGSRNGPSTYLSLEDIETTYQAVFEAKKERRNRRAD